MIDYQLNTRLNGNLAMTFCFHENKALQQDTTLYKFIWVRSGNLTLEIDHIPIQLEQDEIISLTPLQHIEIKSVEESTSLSCSTAISTVYSVMMTKYPVTVSFFMVLPG